MLKLYADRDAQDFDDSGGTVPQAQSRALLASAATLLTARGSVRAAELCSGPPFELRKSSFLFGDEYHILFAAVPLAQYEELRVFSTSGDGHTALRKLAETVSELGTYIRFIAIDLDVTPASRRTADEAARALTTSEIDWIAHRYIGVNGGYLGDFSYRTHRDFYRDLELDIVPDSYPGTTRSRFEQILFEAAISDQARIVGGVLAKYPAGSSEVRTPEAVAKMQAFMARLGGTAPVSHPSALMSSAVVERALADAEQLLGTQGATSAVDRMHTALHGYLLKVCSDAGLAATRDDSLPALLKRIRVQHPRFQSLPGGRANDVTRILKGLGAIVDALNPIRNNASVAHPNEELLDAPEAMLAVNTARSILHYVDARLRG